MEKAIFAENEDGTFGDKANQVVLYRHATSGANIKFRKKKELQAKR